MSLSNPTEGVDTSNAPYVIVSSDTHAGLQCEEYRPYLDSALHDEFDVYVAGRHEHRRVQEEVNAEFLAEWEGENAEGLRGAYDPEVRDKELDADGIAGEVIFADGDAVTGQESPAVRRGPVRGPDNRPPPGLRRGPGPQPLAG